MTEFVDQILGRIDKSVSEEVLADMIREAIKHADTALQGLAESGLTMTPLS